MKILIIAAMLSMLSACVTTNTGDHPLQPGEQMVFNFTPEQMEDGPGLSEFGVKTLTAISDAVIAEKKRLFIFVPFGYEHYVKSLAPTAQVAPSLFGWQARIVTPYSGRQQ